MGQQAKCRAPRACPLRRGQVNTSGEEAKSGVEPQGCVPLAAHIARQCPHLKLAGLMTIGMLDYTSTPENFKCLASCRWVRALVAWRLRGCATAPRRALTAAALACPDLAGCRADVAKELSLQPEALELSMGMSGDFELAVRGVLALAFAGAGSAVGLAPLLVRGKAMAVCLLAHAD